MAHVQEATAVDEDRRVIMIAFTPVELQRLINGEHWLTQKDEDEGPPKQTLAVVCEPNEHVAERLFMALLSEIDTNDGYVLKDTGDSEREEITG